jgi:hypothetical protein
VQIDQNEASTRPLTEQESSWIREILQTRDEWKNADISRTRVISRKPCDEGLSVLLEAPEPENSSPTGLESDYIGRIWICTDDGSVIEVRLDHQGGRLRELFILFVDPRHPQRTLPERWAEVSHEARPL